jgi:hypothetical protein
MLLRCVPDRKFLDVASLGQSVSWLLCPWPNHPIPKYRLFNSFLNIILGGFHGVWLTLCRVRSGQYCRGRMPGILDAVHALRPERSKVVVKLGALWAPSLTQLRRRDTHAVHALHGPGLGHIGKGHNIQGTLCSRGATSKNFRSGTHRSGTHQVLPRVGNTDRFTKDKTVCFCHGVAQSPRGSNNWLIDELSSIQ